MTLSDYVIMTKRSHHLYLYLSQAWAKRAKKNDCTADKKKFMTFQVQQKNFEIESLENA